MKRIVMLVLLGCVLLASVAYAQCVTNQKTIMYFDPAKFFKAAQIATVNHDQFWQLTLAYIEPGDAVVVEAGTKFTEAKTLPENDKIIVCRINSVVMIGLSETVRCK
jgi:TPP-dependent 2-oxoacid decarboxylase